MSASRKERSLGSDVSSLPDLDPFLEIRTGPAVLGEALARRLMTPRGSLFSDPSYGMDVRAWLHESLTPLWLLGLRQAIQTEVEQDERVLCALAQLRVKGRQLHVALEVQTAEGPFSLTLSVNELTVALLTPSS